MTPSNLKDALDQIVKTYRELLLEIRKQACPRCKIMMTELIVDASRRLAKEQKLRWLEPDEHKTQ